MLAACPTCPGRPGDAGTHSKGWEGEAIPAACSRGHACLAKEEDGSRSQRISCPQAGLCGLCEVRCSRSPPAGSGSSLSTPRSGEPVASGRWAREEPRGQLKRQEMRPGGLNKSSLSPWRNAWREDELIRGCNQLWGKNLAIEGGFGLDTNRHRGLTPTEVEGKTI